MMKRAIWILIVIVVGAYFGNSWLEDRARIIAEKAEAEKVKQATKEAVARLVTRTNAFDRWEKDLSKEGRVRYEPILTIELERLWLQDRPILFIGAIRDIATSNGENYTVEIRRDLFSSFSGISGTELQLDLQCSKQKVDLFLKAHPNLFSDYGFNNRVAVVAKINKIETKIVAGSEVQREKIITGKGRCIDMINIGKVFLTGKIAIPKDGMLVEVDSVTEQERIPKGVKVYRVYDSSESCEAVRQKKLDKHPNAVCVTEERYYIEENDKRL